MKPGQNAIYYISGEAGDALARSPQLEGFRARGVEVLLLTDPVDEFWIPSVTQFKDKPFKSVTRGGADLDKIEAPAGEAEKAKEPQAAGIDSLIALFRLTLKDTVKDVRSSERLTDSPVCLVAAEGDMDIHLERMLRQHRQLDTVAKRVLEVNPRHPLIETLAKRLTEQGSGEEIADAAWLLLDQARILDGERLADPAAFARRLSSLLGRALAA